VKKIREGIERELRESPGWMSLARLHRKVRERTARRVNVKKTLEESCQLTSRVDVVFENRRIGCPLDGMPRAVNGVKIRLPKE